MPKTIKLKRPITIDGQQVREITYDGEEITAELYAQAEAKKRTAAGSKNVAVSLAVEFDFALHLYMGFAAAIAVNPGYTFEDLERVKGGDLTQFSEVGRRFLLQSDSSEESSSDEQSEATPAPISPASENSEESQ